MEAHTGILMWKKNATVYFTTEWVHNASQSCACTKTDTFATIQNPGALSLSAVLVWWVGTCLLLGMDFKNAPLPPLMLATLWTVGFSEISYKTDRRDMIHFMYFLSLPSSSYSECTECPLGSGRMQGHISNQFRPTRRRVSLISHVLCDEMWCDVMWSADNKEIDKSKTYLSVSSWFSFQQRKGLSMSCQINVMLGCARGSSIPRACIQPKLSDPSTCELSIRLHCCPTNAEWLQQMIVVRPGFISVQSMLRHANNAELSDHPFICPTNAEWLQ